MTSASGRPVPIKAESNDVEAILTATESLMRELMSRNALEPSGW